MPGTDSLRRTEETTAFEQALGQALAAPEIKEALRRTPDAPRPEHLRLQAHRERTALCATAAAEYETYARLRAEADTPAPGTTPTDSPTATASGGGLLPALAVLVPSLGAIAAVLFLAIGFGMRLVSAHRQFADELVYAGWLAAGIAAAATAADLAWLLATAARNRSTADSPSPATDATAPGSEVAQARAAWHLALLERGIVPFLLTRVQERETERPTGRPGYPAPEYGSPEYGRPEYGRHEYASPGYDSPEYSTTRSPR
ncbi:MULTISPECIES: hypothetical protein [Streptomyces]|uniref:Transmembrane protein n=2 Tax=Streptomyces rimosus subsp. rimosus TaxID=132474 RepID=L8EMX7_STRR1|nr:MULTISPECIES: hypothetical protein [Streptomyces]KOG68439.1 hypothetical protein ADK78_36715 [Kitasatospora aureofaciens]MYT44593.1 hypothetical protein [Streptomyces sp. SID5471]KEF09444.1 hypothetical protein DF17_03660 [Streptomyces rimosus]KOT31915.1 hypothetical protein ADK42_27295 [Streptomyces rimosus subsp. rimosus]KOT32925.1 hypothetical protein ADK84_27110 [Streptomyces sp. NRRL WC-3701]